LFIFLLVTFVSLFFTVYFHTTLTEFFKVLVYLSLFYIVLNCVKEDKIILTKGRGIELRGFLFYLFFYLFSLTLPLTSTL
jgi:hypothetical protein